MITISKLAFVAAILSLASAQINTPGPMLSHPFPTCEQFFQAIPGSNCVSVASVGGVTIKKFIKLNPSVAGKNGPDGCDDSKIIPGYFYCVKPLTAAEGKMKGHPKATPAHKGKPAKPKITKKPDTDKKKDDGKKKDEDQNKDDGKWHISSVSEPYPGACVWGPCWKSWVSLSTGGADSEFSTATNICKQLRTVTCPQVMEEFPTGIRNGCTDCIELSSGCSCEQNGRYHTATVAQVMGRDGLPQEYWTTMA